MSVFEKKISIEIIHITFSFYSRTRVQNETHKKRKATLRQHEFVLWFSSLSNDFYFNEMISSSTHKKVSFTLQLLSFFLFYISQHDEH